MEGVECQIQLGFESGNFRGATAFGEVVEARAGLGKALFSFLKSGGFSLVFEDCDQGVGLDRLAAPDVEGFEGAGQGSREVNVFGFDVTGEDLGLGRLAADQEENRNQGERYEVRSKGRLARGHCEDG
jgi:hypothetical protein